MKNKIAGQRMETRLERMRTIFSTNLRRRMQDLKMSQSDLARAIWKETRPDSRGYQQPVNKDRVSAWINGRVLPSPENLHRCAEALGVTTQDLLPEIEPATLGRVFISHSIDDFTVRMDGDAVIVELKCRTTLTDAQSLMEIFARRIKELDEDNEASNPGPGGSTLMHFGTHAREA
jgi:transcriptional regulator with XRE-family HTH domain